MGAPAGGPPDRYAPFQDADATRREARWNDRTALVFGPADFMASVGIRSLDVGGQPAGYAGGDVYHYALMRILIAACARGLQAIDGPYLKVRDVDGFRRSAASAAALGYDGKWVLHPDQIDAANEVFAPSPDDFARASRIVEAYAHAAGVQARGAVMFGDEMIDEASHKMARAIVARGRASGLGPDAGIESENT